MKSCCGKLVYLEDENSGEAFCGNCGVVFQEKMPTRSRSEMTTDKHGATTVHDAPMDTSENPITGTLIGKDEDAQGKRLSAGVASSMNRLKVWHHRSRTGESVKRNLSSTIPGLRALADKLNVGDPIFEDAAAIYKRAVMDKLVRGRDRPGMAAAAMYAALRRNSVPRSLASVVEKSCQRKKVISRSYRVILNKYDMKMPVPDALNYIPSVVSQLPMSDVEKRVVERYAAKTFSDFVSSGRKNDSRSPEAYAGAVVYYSIVKHGIGVNQRLVAAAADVTEVTIRNTYKVFLYGPGD